MIIEALYPELCNLYGDMANLRYLAACRPQAQIIQTQFQQTPAFCREPVDLLYLGAMPEDSQAMALRRLAPYAAALRDRIEGGMAVLATGNALELFGQGIAGPDGFLPGLGLFPYRSRRDMENRHNSQFLGAFRDMAVVGYKSPFSSSEIWQPFLTVQGGFGTDLQGKQEGVRYKNFFGTYLLGPFLVLNPPFTRYLLELLHSPGPLAFEQAAMEAYQCRLAALQVPGLNFRVGENG